MLDYLRKSASGIVVKALLGLLILSFAAWGIGDVFSSKAGRQVVASVGDIEIGPNAFRNEMTNEVARLKPILGETFDAEQAKMMGLGDAVLRRMIKKALFDQGAAGIGLGISDAVVLAEMRRTPIFQDSSGNFSRNMFQQFLSGSGMNEAYFVQLIRRDMMRQQYLDSVYMGVTLPPVLAVKLYAHENERRVLEIARIEHATVKNIPQPTTSDLEVYHNDNQQFFMTPETRTFTALVLRTEAVALRISVDTADLEKLYEERLDEYTTSQQRHLSQILVNDEVAAIKAADAVTKGRAFATVAKEVGASMGATDIGLFERDQLMAELQAPVFSANKGDIVGPVKSVLGWHVIRIEDTVAEKTRPMNEVRAELEKTLRSERALDELFELSNEVEDLLGGGATLEEAARDLDVEIFTASVDASAKVIGGKLVFGKEMTEGMTKAAFDLETGMETPLLEVETKEGGDAFFIVRLDGVRTPELRPLSDVIKDVTARWTNDARSRTAKSEADKLLALVKGGTSLSEAATAMGYATRTSAAYDRQGRGLESPVPAVLVHGSFGLIPGESRSAEGTGAHVVVVLKSIQAADSNDKTAMNDAVQKALVEVQTDLLDQLSTALQSAHPVSINQSVLDQAY